MIYTWRNKMKKRNQIIAAFLAATMIITPATSIFAKAAKDGSSSAESSYGESFTSWRTNEWENKLSKDWTTVSMTPGVNESTMNFAWYSKTTDTVSLTYGLKADLSDGKTVQITTKGTEQKDKDGNEYNSNKATISGELDDENLSILISKSYIEQIGYLTPEGYWDFNWEQDRFVINGITYKPSGDTQTAQAKDEVLVFMIILKRDRDTKVEFVE
jgi:hypothetical protein